MAITTAQLKTKAKAEVKAHLSKSESLVLASLDSILGSTHNITGVVEVTPRKGANCTLCGVLTEQGWIKVWINHANDIPELLTNVQVSQLPSDKNGEVAYYYANE